MTPTQPLIAALTVIEADLAKLADTTEDTVDTFGVVVAQRRIQALLEAVQTNLYEPESTEC
jgi:hypothetical protein